MFAYIITEAQPERPKGKAFESELRLEMSETTSLTLGRRAEDWLCGLSLDKSRHRWLSESSSKAILAI